MPYLLQQFLLSFVNLAAPVWGIWAAMVLGGMVNRTLGIAISLAWVPVLIGGFWYQFVGAQGSGRYLISTLDRHDEAALVGYDPVSPPWWLPSEHVGVVITIIVVELLIPIVLYVLELRKAVDEDTFRREMVANLGLLVRFLGKALLALAATLLALLVGMVVVIPGLIIGFVLGLPVGVILGILAGFDFETTIFGTAYLGGGLGFLLGGGGIVVWATAGVTGSAARRMNETHNQRRAEIAALEILRRGAQRTVGALDESHRRDMREQDQILARVLRKISGS